MNLFQKVSAFWYKSMAVRACVAIIAAVIVLCIAQIGGDKLKLYPSLHESVGMVSAFIIGIGIRPALLTASRLAIDLVETIDRLCGAPDFVADNDRLRKRIHDLKKHNRLLRRKYRAVPDNPKAFDRLIDDIELTGEPRLVKDE